MRYLRNKSGSSSLGLILKWCYEMNAKAQLDDILMAGDSRKNAHPFLELTGMKILSSSAFRSNKSGATAGGPGPMAMHAQQPGMNPMYGNVNPMGAPPGRRQKALEAKAMNLFLETLLQGIGAPVHLLPDEAKKNIATQAKTILLHQQVGFLSLPREIRDFIYHEHAKCYPSLEDVVHCCTANPGHNHLMVRNGRQSVNVKMIHDKFTGTGKLEPKIDENFIRSLRLGFGRVALLLRAIGHKLLLPSSVRQESLRIPPHQTFHCTTVSRCFRLFMLSLHLQLRRQLLNGPSQLAFILHNHRPGRHSTGRRTTNT
ncbi:hypothetical protein E6O75_ATG07853 [Venturia nashicola]|uniref:Uncharacterized protein n=1 Tax=Venturia nashicola TaxID=86259 RepID=A0A4Z1NIV1_9PEZI|nr:hypothetical protein E6O75_ATG07853 [Venturia nashicola]